MEKVVRLYHGSDAAIERPDISFNRSFATAEEVAQILVPAKLTVQFCLRDQGLIDRALTFVGGERYPLQ